MTSQPLSVTLLGYYGGDETHCLSAWQSTHLELTDDLAGNLPDEISERISWLFHQTVVQKKKSPEELLHFLANSDPQHKTPFEKSCLHFQIRGDIATHIHQIKHRIGVSINSESARYKELEDKWLIPDDWKDQLVDNPQSIGFLSNHITWGEVLEQHSRVSKKLYHAAIADLGQKEKLGRKRAKETARYLNLYNTLLDYDTMFNFSSFMHFQKTRNSGHAQKEVRWVASKMLDLVKSIPGNPFEFSLKAFGM